MDTASSFRYRPSNRYPWLVSPRQLHDRPTRAWHRQNSQWRVGILTTENISGITDRRSLASRKTLSVGIVEWLDAVVETVGGNIDDRFFHHWHSPCRRNPRHFGGAVLLFLSKSRICSLKISLTAAWWSRSPSPNRSRYSGALSEPSRWWRIERFFGSAALVNRSAGW